jgi:hypothetical protein
VSFSKLLLYYDGNEGNEEVGLCGRQVCRVRIVGMRSIWRHMVEHGGLDVFEEVSIIASKNLT